MKRFVISLMLMVFVTTACWAAEENDMLVSSGQDITIVLGCGLGGSILGLSTLSFVDKPGDHLNNIIVGGAIGLIVGVAAVAWNQASKSQSGYLQQAQVGGPDFTTGHRYSWHQRAHQKSLTQSGFRSADVGYSFSF